MSGGRFSEDTLFDAETITNETKNTEAVELEYQYGYSVWASCSGTTIAGTIRLQASVDGTNWEDVSSSSQTLTDSFTFLWNQADVFYKYFRVRIISTNANTVTATVKFSAKGV